LAERNGADVVTVYDVHTLKPFDIDNVVAGLGADTVVLTVEEHNVQGGLGSMVQEYLAERQITNRVHKHGLQDEYVIVGPPAHLYTYYGLDADGITVVAGRLLHQPNAHRPTTPVWDEADRRAALETVRARRTVRSSQGGAASSPH
jgi:deoxyxylulose-5-phosphate synthase